MDFSYYNLASVHCQKYSQFHTKIINKCSFDNSILTTLFVSTYKYHAFAEHINIFWIWFFLPFLLAEMLCLEHCQSEQKRLKLSHSSNFNNPKPSFRTNAALETLGYNFLGKAMQIKWILPEQNPGY